MSPLPHLAARRGARFPSLKGRSTLSDDNRLTAILPTWLLSPPRWRIGLTYRWKHGRWPQLTKPLRFTEFVQRRKLEDRDPRIPARSDKVAVKAHVATTLGTSWVTPTLWHGTELPEQVPVPLPFVMKARHGCGQVEIVRDEFQWQQAKASARRWVRQTYGSWLDEWAYQHIPRGLLIEPLLGDGVVLPIDYKFIVISARVECIEVHLDRKGNHRWVTLDRDWNPISQTPLDIVEAPVCLAEMIEGAERLGRDHDCVRIDLYVIDNRPRFGEMTFYPGSGLLPINPLALDLTLGQAWARASRTV